MEILVWLLPGVLIGWTAAMLLRRESGAGMLANVVLGTLGAAAGCWLLGPWLGIPMTVGAVVAANLQMAVLGSILLLAAANLLLPASLFRARRPRRGRSAAATTSGEQPARG